MIASSPRFLPTEDGEFNGNVSDVPERIWLISEDASASWSGSFRRFHCSDLDHGDDYVSYVRAGTQEEIASLRLALSDERRRSDSLMETLDKYQRGTPTLSHPDQTSPMTVGPEEYFEKPLADRLRERAVAAREEGNATATADALHFEEAAAELDRLRLDLEFWKKTCAIRARAALAGGDDAS